MIRLNAVTAGCAVTLKRVLSSVSAIINSGHAALRPPLLRSSGGRRHANERSRTRFTLTV